VDKDPARKETKDLKSGTENEERGRFSRQFVEGTTSKQIEGI